MLLCDSLGLLSSRCGWWEARLESFGSQPVFGGERGRVGKVVQVVSEVERGSEKEEGGGAFLSCVIKDSSHRLLATTGLT